MTWGLGERDLAGGLFERYGWGERLGQGQGGNGLARFFFFSFFLGFWFLLVSLEMLTLGLG